MCNTPIHIKNNSRRILHGVSPLHFDVPCGHCKDCQKQLQDDWYIRALFEWKRVKALGGDLFFPTLTYRDSDLPWYFDENYGFECPCFNLDDIKGFRDKLRVNLKRKGYPDTEIRYLAIPEYGDEKGRSHYHVLLFVPFFIDVHSMLDILRRSWCHGFIGISKRGLLMQSIKGVNYAMKYLSKPQKWYKKYGILEYERKLKEDVKQAEKCRVLDTTCPDDDDNYHIADAAQDILNTWRKCKPHRSASKFFGITGLDYFTSDGEFCLDKLVQGFIDPSQAPLNYPQSDNFKFRIPRYYYRKLFFDLDENNLFVHNELYNEVYKRRFDFQVKLRVQALQPYFSPLTCHQHLSPLGLDVNTCRDIAILFLNKLDGRTVQDLALYDMAYKDVPAHLTPLGYQASDCPITYRTLLDDAYNFIVMQHNTHFYVDAVPEHCSMAETCKSYFNHSSTYGNLPIFEHFDFILNEIASYESSLGMSLTSAYEIEQEQASKLPKTDSYYWHDTLPVNSPVVKSWKI